MTRLRTVLCALLITLAATATTVAIGNTSPAAYFDHCGDDDFVLANGPCVKTAMAVETSAPLVIHGGTVKFTGRLTAVNGQGLPGRPITLRLHSIDADGQGEVFGPFDTDTQGRFSRDVKAESYGPLYLSGEYGGGTQGEVGCSEMAVVWSAPQNPAPAQGRLATTGFSDRKTTVSGGGFEPNADIGILLYPGPRLVTRLAADDQGVFGGEVTLPAEIGGEHKLVAAGIDAKHEQIRYLDATITLSGGRLPVTGAPVWTIASVAGVLIVMGLLIVAWARRPPQK